MTHDTQRVNEIPVTPGAEETQERFTSLFASLVRNSSDIITVLDSEGRFRFISDSLTDVLGWRPEELIGQLSFPFIHPDDREGGLAALGRVIADPSRLVTHRYRLLHRDGRYVPIEGRATNLLADPFIRGILINSRDITHRLEEEETLRRVQTSLQGEVETRTVEILAANELLHKEIEERRQAEEHLRRRLTEAGALERISRMFLTADSPDFHSILQSVGEAMQASRVFLHLLREGMIIEASYEWCPRPEDKHSLFESGTQISEFGWSFQKMCRNEMVSVPDVRQLPPEAVWEKELSRRLHATAFVLVPILAKSGSIWGIVGIERSDGPHTWTPEEERFVRVASEIIVHYDTARRAEQALRESETRFRTLFENAAFGMVMGDEKANCLACNRSFTELTGYTMEDMRGKSYADLTHPEDLERSRETFQTAVNSSGNSYQIQKRYIRKDGRTIWANVSVSIIKDSDGKTQYVFGVFEDITQERETQQQLLAYQERLRSLASQLSLAEEQQRRRIAADLHDRIGQALAMVKIKLGACHEPAIHAGMEGHLEEIQNLLDQIISEVRSLIFEISPPVLYEFGFEKAVEWLAEEMGKRYSLPVTVVDDRQPKPMEEDIRVLLFQAVRELLVNVIKHSRALSAAVTLHREEGWIRVNVSDDGIGFDPASVRSSKSKGRGFGLFNIQERLASIGGKLEMPPPGPKGTRITLLAPLRAPGKKGKKRHDPNSAGRRP